MSKCRRCHRELKNHTESGLGKVCQMKANRLSETSETKIRVEPLFLTNRRQPRRAYLVYSSPRVKVIITEDSNGKIAECECQPKVKCSHIELIAEIDNTKFPQELGLRV